MRKARVAALLALLTAVVASPPLPAQAPMSRTETELARRATDSTWAAAIEVMKRGDAKTLAAFYTRDATIVEADSPDTRSRAAVESLWKAYFAQYEYRAVSRTVTQFEADGDLAFEAARATYTFREKGQSTAATSEVRQLFVWKRQPDGRWLIRFVVETPPAASTPRS